jgi:hypothetical protein
MKKPDHCTIPVKFPMTRDVLMKHREMMDWLNSLGRDCFETTVCHDTGSYEIWFDKQSDAVTFCLKWL